MILEFMDYLSFIVGVKSFLLMREEGRYWSLGILFIFSFLIVGVLVFVMEIVFVFFV